MDKHEDSAYFASLPQLTFLLLMLHTRFAHRSYGFDEPNIASAWCTQALMMGFIVTYAITLIIQLPSMSVDDQLKDALTMVGMIVSPGQCLSAGLSNYLTCKALDLDPWQWEVDNEYVQGGILQPLVFLWLQCIVFSLTLVICENKMLGRFCKTPVAVFHAVVRGENGWRGDGVATDGVATDGVARPPL